MSSAPGHTDVTAILLCGGTSQRFGGGDKTAAPMGRESILSRIVRQLPPTWDVVAVGEPRALPREVLWTSEEPPQGGPLAGIAAGLADTFTPYVVVIAGDQPFAGECAPALVSALRARDDVDAVAAADSDGEWQPLLAAYRLDPVRLAVPANARDKGVRRALSGLAAATIPLPEHATWDVDTTADLTRALRQLDKLPPLPPLGLSELDDGWDDPLGAPGFTPLPAPSRVPEQAAPTPAKPALPEVATEDDDPYRGDPLGDADFHPATGTFPAWPARVGRHRWDRPAPLSVESADDEI